MKPEERHKELRRLVAESGMSYESQVLLNARIDRMIEAEKRGIIGNWICIILGIVTLLILLLL